MYILFNLIYILAFDGTNSPNLCANRKLKEYVYPSLDWKNNTAIAIGSSFGVIIGLTLAFCIYYLIAMLRDCCWEKYVEAKKMFNDVSSESSKSSSKKNENSSLTLSPHP